MNRAASANDGSHRSPATSGSRGDCHRFIWGAVALLTALAAGLPAQKGPLPLMDVPGLPRRGINALGQATFLPKQAVANRVLVGLRPGAGVEGAAAVGLRLGGRVRRVLPISGVAVIDLPFGSDLGKALTVAQAAPQVEFAQPDYILYAARTPPDERYADQWHHPLIRSPEAWEVSTGASSVVIAVIDSGADLDHPDIAPNLYTNAGEIPGNGQDDDGNGYVDDVHGWDFYDGNNDPSPTPDGQDEDGRNGPDDNVTHGTLSAGLAAAASSSFGSVGVSWGARIMPLQVFPDDGGTATSIVYEAMDYAVLMGVDIVNMSLGGGYSTGFNRPVYAIYQAGIVLVAAAGNDGLQFTTDTGDWFSPACNDGPNPATDNYVLGVAATDQNDRRASFSNYDGSGYKLVDVCAPGQAVFGPGYQSDAFPAFQGYFARGDGTSFSAPIVSGLVALLKGREPGLTNAELIERVRAAGDSVDALNPGFAGKLGRGRVNVARVLGVDLPPAAVTNLTGADTPNDQGGSTTLRWRRSFDDGGGAQDVAEYVIRRAGQAAGPFADLATVPAGRERHDDTSVVDHVPYYYQVVSRDGAGGETASTMVGPVSARDDLAPPVVAGVSAADEPGDAGGAIRVAWPAYAAPEDFGAFRIYRRQFSFVTVDGLTPLATVTDPAATSYLDDTSTDGVDYWYAVTAVDAEPNERTDVAAAGPVQSYPNERLRLEEGLHFLATPVVPTDRDPAAFFGVPPSDLDYARWDSAAAGGLGQYLWYHQAPTSQKLLLDHGRGFWLGTATPLEVAPLGATAPSGPFGLQLQRGWQQLGNPFLSPMDFTAATVESGTVAMDLVSAEAAGIMRRFAWVYDTDSCDYELIDRVVGEEPRLIAPWEGFWVLVLKPCRLVFDRYTEASATQMDTQDTPRPAWSLQLVASTATSRDAANYVGVATQGAQLDVEAPPAFAPGVRLELRGRGGACAAAFQRPSARGWSWDFTVTSDVPGGVTLVAPDLSAVPAEYAISLMDRDAGRSIQLRTTPSYRYTATEAGLERHFRLTVRPRGAVLAVTGTSATPTRGGAEVRFVLSADAACDVEVLNLAGRLVRRIVTGRDCAAGQQVILWNGRNEGGVAVPNGTYLVRVRARSVGGEAAQGLSTASVIR